MSEHTKSKVLLSPSRRRFLAGLATGAAAAPFLALSRAGVNAREAAAASLCYSNKRVLGPADFTYLGAMRVPAQGVDMVFSYGGLTGRKVNGQVQLLMVGSRSAGDPVYEFADTGSYHRDPSQAPRMNLVRNWGDVYGNIRKSWLPDGTERTIDATRYMGGYHFNPETGLLYWTYADSYNTTGQQDWCLGATRLDQSGAVPVGPWRPAGEGKKGPWRCIRLAQHPLTGEMLCGSGVMSGNHSAPWGPDLWAGPYPTASTPSGFAAPDIPLQKYVTYYPMFNNINRDGTFSGPLKAFRRGDYVFEPVSEIATNPQIDPAKNGGVGSWSEVDVLGGNAWIDLPDAHGVIFTGRMGSGHIWYRNEAQGADKCTHGLSSPVGITGGVSTAAYPIMIIYDPADLDAVRAGRKVDYMTDPMHVVNMEARFGVATAPITEVGSANLLGGTYFDQDTRKLYVSAPQADRTIPGLMNPIVHVFRVA
jgi:hypothetical protein